MGDPDFCDTVRVECAMPSTWWRTRGRLTPYQRGLTYRRGYVKRGTRGGFVTRGRYPYRSGRVGYRRPYRSRYNYRRRSN